MRHYVIFVEKPVLRLEKSCTVNSVGQFIAFDGKATEKQVLEAGQGLIHECAKVQIFRGKNLGKLLKEYTEP